LTIADRNATVEEYVSALLTRPDGLMALTLDQYASYLDSRDLNWPALPEVKPPRAKPHLVRMPEVRAVTWSVYGTLLAIAEGDLLFEHPKQLLMTVALDKTIQEFKMWSAMTRKPGQPADYLQQIYKDLLAEQRMRTTPGEKYPEIQAERVWEAFLKRLLQKEYKYDVGMYGGLGEYSKKIAYFFHASMQGTGCYPGAGEALRYVAERGLKQGLIANGQCFTTVQLQRGLAAQGGALESAVSDDLIAISSVVTARKPSERLFRHVLDRLAERGVEASEVLHVGASLPLDVVPARRLGMRTALYAGDRAAVQVKREQLREKESRPDVLLTELGQITEIVGE
jgi:FMN phosphatase YigB (HAD superfamily)